MAKTREERLAYLKEWQSKNKEKLAVLRRSWYEKNQKKVKASRLRWIIKNADKDKASKLAWRIKNKERRAWTQRVLLAKYKRLVIDAYGGKCECCKEKEITFLTIEHSRRDGMSHRKSGGNFYLRLIREGFPKDQGLKCLCMNCNWAERNGYPCPHKKEE